MIVTNGISKAYGNSLVVDDVSITIPVGGLTSIIGPNGAGKSTLLSIIARLMAMDKGTVTVDGMDVTTTQSDQLARRLSILRQDNHISSRLTVLDLVKFGRYPYSKGRPTVEDKVHVDQAMQYLNLEPLADRFLDELSGGQRQRAFVAMVLCQYTDYVLLDEPLNNLDMKHASAMMKILRKAADDLKKTVVLVLHDINFASWYSDHIIAMRDGKVWGTGTVNDIINTDALREIYDMQIAIHEINGRRIGLFYE
ncbi:ABC transporter ATP-binding protein [Agrobacterium sp. AGB01]|uniref:iron ABC transporter ATP-binding protein n=1 Tax=Agrobacterium sp. AGB01 TaxID=2769302 RepID=UPI00177DD556|nr:ABC transporter ATP-binding protein [Agrobacterium sp. AGB01]MBD9388238.1 ABC transporter ATP-binding protein [Agrobacterium sp. AGB01]